MDDSAVRDIIGIYLRHGWTLRRVLLSAASRAALADKAAMMFGEAEILPSTVDAAWFSRGRTDGGTAWEIRYLGPVQYALVTVVDDGGELEAEMSRLEKDLAEAITRQPARH